MIPMLLACPMCGERHIDRGAFATKPHHTHACQNCGMVWRPAIVATVGVNFLPGFKDPSGVWAEGDPCMEEGCPGLLQEDLTCDFCSTKPKMVHQ